MQQSPEANGLNWYWLNLHISIFSDLNNHVKP